MTDFIFLGSQIIADGDCRHKIKRCLLLGRKDMTDLDSALKSKDITAAERLYSPMYTVCIVLWCFKSSCTDVRAGP